MEITGETEIGEVEVNCPLCDGNKHTKINYEGLILNFEVCPCCKGIGSVEVEVGEVEVSLEFDRSDYNEGYY